jgi:hypothetical protein
MGGVSAAITGRAVTVAGTGATVVLPRDGILLGFFSSVSQAIALYDSNAAGTLTSQQLAATACAVGWNPLPLSLDIGLVAVAATGNVTYVIA